MQKSALFIALTALLLIAGCSTPIVPSTPKQHPDKYALQILRIEVPINESGAKSLRNQQSVLLSNKNESTFLLPKPIKSNPVNQVSDTGDPLLNMLRASYKNIEELLNDPNATITEFPIVYAGIGETAITIKQKRFSHPKDTNRQQIQTEWSALFTVMTPQGSDNT